MSRGNGSAAPDPLDDLEEVIADLEGSEWEDETTETNIIVQGGVVNVDNTGKHRALQVSQDDRLTPSDPPSQPPKARFALAVLDRIQPPWLRAPVVIVVVLVVAALVWRGAVALP